ncbi:hypothetical protein NZL82_15345 [Sphingomonas sanguinis]|uniref:hypothetical protein n=1 Tax=Sphingomonas sp. LC-1 TaxID=3110957 RepID=UPI0021BB4EF7|nr:hypothetical protein [Sphingomonas sp. LC-1]MCT8003250.1 hypothetical protein [Sphingomonas sp. LC-1]
MTTRQTPDAVRRLQAAWDGCGSLPPIQFSESEADAILAALDSRAGDAVRDALSEAIGALQPFADADEGDAEDEPHMQVWPTFTVGDLRRAVEAVKSGKATLSATPAPAVDAVPAGEDMLHECAKLLADVIAADPGPKATAAFAAARKWWDAYDAALSHGEGRK